MADERIIVFKLQLDATATIKTQNDLIKRNKELGKLLRNAPKEGQEGFDELRDSIDRAKKEFASNRNEIVRFNRELREIDVPDDSLKGLSRTLRELEDQYKTLSGEERRLFGEELKRNIVQTRNALKQAEEELGDFRRNVGNYPKEADIAARATAALNRSISQFSKIIKAGFGLNRLSSAVSRITGFFGDIIEANRDTNAVIGGVAAGFDQLGNAVNSFGSNLVQFLAPAINAVTGFFTGLVNSVNSVLNPLDTAVNAFKEQAAVVSNLEQNTSPLLDRYDELANKTELSADEQKELNSIVKEVTATIPGAASEFDQYGNAIAISTDAARDFIQVQQNILAARNRERIAEQTKALEQAEADLVRQLRERGQTDDEITQVFVRNGRSQEEAQKAFTQASKNLQQQDELATASRVAFAGSTAGVSEAIRFQVNLLDDLEQSSKSVTEVIQEGLATRVAEDEAIARTRGQIAGLIGDLKDLDGSNIKQLTTIDVLRQQQSRLRSEIEQLAVNYEDYSVQLNNLRAVEERLALAENALKKERTEQKTQIEILREEQSKLIEQVENLALQRRDFSSQTARLIEIEGELLLAENALQSIQDQQLNILERRTARQKELEDQIKLNIATNQPYAEQLEELRKIIELNTQEQKEYEDALKSTDNQTKDYSDGSLKDYSSQLTKLNEDLQKATIGSEKYNEIQAKIDALTKEQNDSLTLLNANTEKFIQTTQQYQDIAEVQTQRLAALRKAQQALSEIDTQDQEERANAVRAINEQLANDLAAIDQSVLTNRKQALDAELAAVNENEQQQLANADLTEDQKTAIKRIAEQERARLLGELLGIEQQISKQELDDFKAKEQAKTDSLREQQQLRAAAERAAFQITKTISDGTIGLVQQSTDRRLEEQKRLLDAELQASLASAEAVGASEETKLELERQAQQRSEELERAAAEKKKALSITQAVINTALSITQSLAQLGIPLGIPAAAAAAAAGAVQIATIASAKLAKGDILTGPSHDNGGIPVLVGRTNLVEMEGGEAVVNKKSTSAMPNLLSAINQMYGGKRYAGTSSLTGETASQLRGLESSIGATVSSFTAVPRLPQRTFQTGGITSAATSLESQFNSQAFLRAVETGAQKGTEIGAAKGFAMAAKSINDRARKQNRLESRLEN